MTQAQQSSGLTISPLRREDGVSAGFVSSGSLLITNNNVEARQIDLSAESFNVTNQAYDYLFKVGTPETTWVTFDQTSLSLGKDESATVNYQVSVPIGTEPGGYYLALFALNRPLSTVSGISPTERVASLLYLTVLGDASREGKFVQLNSPVIVFNQADWSATLQNSGTLHYRSTYTASVRSVFNQELTVKEDSRLILPNSVRLVEDSLILPPILGLYKVVYTISLGDSPSYQETRWFLYLPPIQTGLILLIIVALIFLLRTNRRKAA